MIPGQGVARGLRATLFALSAVGLAAAAHVAGGEPVNAVVAVAAVPAIAGVMNLLARRRRGPAALLTSLAATQLLLHEAFMATSGPAGCHTTAQGMAGMPGMAALVTVHCLPMSHGRAGSMTAAMLVTHGLATVLTALVLARGEAAVWELAQWLGFRSLTAAPGLLPRVRPTRVLSRTAVALPSRAATPFRRRGPPDTAFSLTPRAAAS